jgi:hypothetical protein
LIVQLLDDPAFVPAVSPRVALGVLTHLGALQSRMAAVAAGDAGEGADGPRLYELKDVAERLQMSMSQVYRLAASGDLVTVVEGRSKRVAKADLERYIAKRRSGSDLS